MQSKLDRRALLAAAVGGLLLGASCKGSSPGSAGEIHAAASGASSAAPHKGDKACCKGLNDCKGKGGCAVAGKHDCAGKNDCKGQGGCDMRC